MGETINITVRVVNLSMLYLVPEPWLLTGSVCCSFCDGSFSLLLTDEIRLLSDTLPSIRKEKENQGKTVKMLEKRQPRDVCAVLDCLEVIHRGLGVWQVVGLDVTKKHNTIALTCKSNSHNSGSGVAGFFMGMFLSPEIPCNNYRLISWGGILSYSMDAGCQYIQGQVDWNRVGNDSIIWLQSLSAQVSSTPILGKKTAPNFIQQTFGTQIELF